MKSALVTGADGFIGRNLVRKLLLEGVQVHAVVYPGNNIYLNDEYKSQDNLHVYTLDLTHVLNHITDFPEKIEVMYHFAWNGVKPELRNDLDIQIGNVGMSLDCMKLAIARSIKKIVYPGSTNEYLYAGKPLNRDAVPSPNNAYGAAKIALRYLCSDFATRNNIEFIYAIIAGIYAADRRDNNVIYYTIDKLLHGESPDLTKCEQLWDYVYIDDVIDALIAIGNKGKGGAVYAIGHGDNWPLKNYINSIHEKIDPSIPIGFGKIPYRSETLPSSCIDLTDLKKDTGFEPRIDFEEGISRVIETLRSDMERK